MIYTTNDIDEPTTDAEEVAEDAPSSAEVQYSALLGSLRLHGDLTRAVTALTRDLLETRQPREARTLAQVLQREHGTAQLGDLCMAIVACRSRMWELARDLFEQIATARCVQATPVEYFRVGFRSDPRAAAKLLESVGEYDTWADARDWLTLARIAFAAGAETSSQAALELAQQAASQVADPVEAEAIRADVAWMLPWYGRTDVPHQPSPVSAGNVSVALLSYGHPDRRAASQDLGDRFETLAALGHLVRRTEVRFTGDPELVAFAERLRARVPATEQLADNPARVGLCVVDRDAARCADVPPGTWLLYSGTIPQPIFEQRIDLPMHPNIRPIFVSLHVDSPGRLTDEVVEYLRRHAPIGCRDRHSALLLHAAGVPAFFAGGLVSTIDLVAGADDKSPRRRKALFVDAGDADTPFTASQQVSTLPYHSLPEGLQEALHRLDDHRRHARLVTTQLQSYLAGRALGIEVKFRPPNRSAAVVHGLLGMDDADFAAMRARLSDRLDALYAAILSGADEADVYTLWAQLCAPDVAEIEATLRDLPPIPPPSFDVAATCAAIRAASVTHERTAAAPPGEEINVEFSLDANYKHQLDVVLDAVVFHASRPVRAFILCRNHDEQDFARLALTFPTVTFVFLPTDAVDYGPQKGLLSYTTVATMDRLLLPELLPEVARIVHHDLDALCLVDLAEFYDIDLQGTPIAGRSSPSPHNVSAFNAFTRGAQRRSRQPSRGHELMRRLCARHTFDFPTLNAGIMLLDLDVMRADRFCDEFIPWVEHFDMHDQSVLNMYAGARRVESAPGWNWRPWLEPMAEPKIAHWAGTYKPWSSEWVVGKDLWQQAERRLADRLGIDPGKARPS